MPLGHDQQRSRQFVLPSTAAGIRAKEMIPFFRALSSHRYCRDRAGVHCLLAVAGIAGVGIDDPRLVVPQFEDLGAEFSAEAAANTEVHINNRSSHSLFPSFSTSIYEGVEFTKP